MLCPTMWTSGRENALRSQTRERFRSSTRSVLGRSWDTEEQTSGGAMFPGQKLQVSVSHP
jgi:hypothetical protein